MKRVEVIQSFKYAFKGFRVVQYDPGVQDIPDEVVESAVKNKQAKIVPLDKLKADDLKALVFGSFPKEDIPEKMSKVQMIEWLETGIRPLFDQGVVALADMEVAELLSVAREKYPEVTIPDVVEKEDLIVFIADGDVAVFGSDDLQDKEISELLEIAKDKHPDVEIPPEVEKEVLIKFIESGVASVLVSGGAN